MSSKTNSAGQPEAAPRKRWLWYALLGVAGVAVLLLATLVGLRLYFSDAYLKSRVAGLLEERLGRPCTIGDLNASILSGTVALKEVRILPAAPSSASTAAPCSLSRAEVQVSLWTLVLSSFTEIKGARVELEGLRLDVARKREGARYVTD